MEGCSEQGNGNKQKKNIQKWGSNKRTYIFIYLIDPPTFWLKFCQKDVMVVLLSQKDLMKSEKESCEQSPPPQ